MARKIYDAVRRVANALSMICLALICYSIAAQIFTRFVLGRSLIWTEEVGQLALIGLVFLMLAEVQKENQHLQLEIIFTLMPKVAPILMTIGRVLLLVYCGAILYSEYLMLPSVRMINSKAAQIPIRYIHWVMVVGVILWTVQIVIELVHTFRGKKGGEQA